MQSVPLRNKQGLTEEEFLAQYKPSAYPRPSVTVDMLLFTIENNALKMLLIRRQNHPYMHAWALPGGFVGIDESIDQAVYRELAEETNITQDVYFEQLYTFGEVQRDPRMRVISCAYISLTPSSNIKNTRAGDDAEDAAWFTVELTKAYRKPQENCYELTLTSEEKNVRIKYTVKERAQGMRKTYDLSLSDASTDRLAFDHAHVVHMALQRLKNKVSYTAIAFSLLPKQFTLGQLQKVYEVLLGEKLDRANFRKAVRHMVRQVGQQTTKSARRSVMLFEYDPLSHTD